MCANYIKRKTQKECEHRRYGSNLFFYSRREFITDQDMTLGCVRNASVRGTLMKFSTNSFVTYDGINLSTKRNVSPRACKSNLYTPLALGEIHVTIRVSCNAICGRVECNERVAGERTSREREREYERVGVNDERLNGSAKTSRYRPKRE